MKNLQSRIIAVHHPLYKDVVLFEAKVEIRDINRKYVKSINGVEIKYDLKSDSTN